MESSAVSAPLLACINKVSSENWIPPEEFLLGLGQPWKPDAWEYGDEDEDSALVASSQVVDKLAMCSLEVKEAKKRPEVSSRWSNSQADAKAE